MTVMLELAPEVEQRTKAKAEARGISLEEYLPSLIAYAMQQEDWAETTSEESLGRLTMLAAEPVLSRIWNTPEEDAAWQYLEEDASAATVAGSLTTLNRLDLLRKPPALEVQGFSSAIVCLRRQKSYPEGYTSYVHAGEGFLGVTIAL